MKRFSLKIEGLNESKDDSQDTNFKPRTDYMPEKTVGKKRSETRRLSVGDVKLGCSI